MTDSPSPIDSSFDASDIATPCTVIAAKTRNLRDLKIEEEDGEDSSHGDEEEVSAIYVDDFSKTDFSEGESSVMEPLPRPPSFARTITKVYCHMDNEEVPYMVEVHVPPDCITLRDVKRKLTRTNYKFFCIALDPDSGLEVKAEIRDDSNKLYPLKDGRFQLFLLTIEGSVHSDTSSGRHRKQKTSSKGSSSSREFRAGYEHASVMSEVSSDASSLPTYVKKAHAYNRRHGAPPQYGDLRQHLLQKQRHRNIPYQQQQNPYEESSFDVTESDVYGGGHHHHHQHRDGETFYDEDDDSRSINTDLTSVSQQHLKKMYREQQARAQNKWKSAMSTTSSSFTDITESSMGVEIITVRLNLETLPLGMIPCGDTDSRGDSGLFVGSITDRGAVALDGRIDIGDMILEINGVSLQNHTNQQAANLLNFSAVF
uniref:Uncharacterized protein n=1 Tax=Caenorhabditis japonica TaxID=281687 RepID=A0A8R1DI95_CAEJA